MNALFLAAAPPVLIALYFGVQFIRVRRQARRRPDPLAEFWTRFGGNVVRFEKRKRGG